MSGATAASGRGGVAGKAAGAAATKGAVGEAAGAVAAASVKQVSLRCLVCDSSSPSPPVGATQKMLQIQPLLSPLSPSLPHSRSQGSSNCCSSGDLQQLEEKLLFEKFWKGTSKAVSTPRPESTIVASITSRSRPSE